MRPDCAPWWKGGRIWSWNVNGPSGVGPVACTKALLVPYADKEHWLTRYEPTKWYSPFEYTAEPLLGVSPLCLQHGDARAPPRGILLAAKAVDHVRRQQVYGLAVLARPTLGALAHAVDAIAVEHTVEVGEAAAVEVLDVLRRGWGGGDGGGDDEEEEDEHGAARRGRGGVAVW